MHLIGFVLSLSLSQAAKDVVLAEKPLIGDDSNQLDPSLLDELLANVATLSSVFHKPAGAFVTRVKTVQRAEEDDYTDGTEGGDSETPAHASDTGASPPSIRRQPAAAPAAPPSMPDLLDLMGLDNDSSAIVSVDQPEAPSGYVNLKSIICFIFR